MKRKLQKEYLKSLAILTSGSMVSILLTAFYQILQTRIFSAEIIGNYSFLMTFPLMFISVISLRYEIPIVTEKNIKKSFALIKLSLIICFAISIIISSIYFIYIYYFKMTYRMYLYIIPIVFIILLGYGVNNIISSYNNRCREYTLISQMQILRTLVQYGLIVLFGYYYVIQRKKIEYSILILTIPYGISLFAGIIRQSQSLLKYKSHIIYIKKELLISVMKENYRQPLYSTPALFINSFSFFCVNFIIESLFGNTQLGYYSISDRILGIPLLLISANVSKIFIEKAAKENIQDNCFKKSFSQSFIFLSIISIPFFILLYKFAPYLCILFLGKKWEPAGYFVRILSFLFAIRLVGNSLSPALVIVNKQLIELIINILLTITSLASGFLTYYLKQDIYFFLRILCLFKSLCYISLIIIVFYYSLNKQNILKRKS